VHFWSTSSPLTAVWLRAWASLRVKAAPPGSPTSSWFTDAPLSRIDQDDPSFRFIDVPEGSKQHTLVGSDEQVRLWKIISVYFLHLFVFCCKCANAVCAFNQFIVVVFDTVSVRPTFRWPLNAYWRIIHIRLLIPDFDRVCLHQIRTYSYRIIDAGGWYLQILCHQNSYSICPVAIVAVLSLHYICVW